MYDLSQQCIDSTVSSVHRGIKLLDEHVPGWHKSVTPGTLDCTSGRNNVLGQLFGTSEEGCIILGSGAGDRDFLFHFGFCVNSLENWKAQARLVDDTWMSAILSRMIVAEAQ
jgi:hypothetical protein